MPPLPLRAGRALPPSGAGVLRVLTCGSVDDGKSTLIGRLLVDSRQVFKDQLATLAADSARFGTTGPGRLDVALLVDGLQAEREQGITIDVAYRFFTTARRGFILADTPGHEQYTRNMVTGASLAQVAILLVDARHGLHPQTRRHATIVSLLGLRHVVLAVNKMDLVDWSETAFRRIVSAFAPVARDLGLTGWTAIPLSALEGDNVARHSDKAGWYRGPALLTHLEEIEVEAAPSSAPFRLPVQWVNRPDPGFRGYAGTIAGGSVRPGDRVAILPSGRAATVERIVTMDGDLSEAVAGQAVTLTLVEQVDVGRGDLIVADAARAGLADRITAHIVWMDPHPLLPGRLYLMRIGPRTVQARVIAIRHRIDVTTQRDCPARQLDLNEIGLCVLALHEIVAIDAYAENRTTGGFILIDPTSNATIGCGMVTDAACRGATVHWQPLDVDMQARAALKGQKPCLVWFTGLSGSGKSTVANLVERKLLALGRHTFLLDGDNIRHGLCRDLGFGDADRVENIRRVGECGKLFVEAGLIVLAAFIAPFPEERRLVRALVAEDEFIEVFMDTPLEECERRDPKGLYRLARAGRLTNFTGIDSPYVPPSAPDLRIDPGQPPDAAADLVIALLARRGRI